MTTTMFTRQNAGAFASHIKYRASVPDPYDLSPSNKIVLGDGEPINITSTMYLDCGDDGEMLHIVAGGIIYWVEEIEGDDYVTLYPMSLVFTDPEDWDE